MIRFLSNPLIGINLLLFLRAGKGGFYVVKKVLIFVPKLQE